MNARIRIEEVVRLLGRDVEGLVRELRAEGLFETDELEPPEAEELRVAVMLMRDLGVNPAGVDVALQLRRRLLALESHMHDALEELLHELERR